MKRLVLVLVVFGFACNASATPINTSAEVLTSVTVPEQTSFDLGQFMAGAPGGVARWVSAGTPALVTIVVTVTVTGTTQASGVDTLVIVGHCRGPGGALGVDNGNCTFSSNEVIADSANIGDKTP